MKAALCFIISYKHILNKEDVWKKWIQPNADIINVYFHYKNINSIKSKWIRQHCIPENIIQPTSYYDVVPAYMAIMNFAHSHDEENKWFCLLTDSCVPIISPYEFRHMFFEYSNKSIFNWKPSYWNVEIHRRANLRYFDKSFRLANDPWFILTRKHINACNIFLKTQPNSYSLICNGGLANESIFAIMLKCAGQLVSDSVIKESSTITDWSRMQNPTSPYTFTFGSENENDVLIIERLLIDNPYSIFLRKVSPSFPNEIIFEFWEKKIRHKDSIDWTFYLKLIFVIFLSYCGISGFIYK
jgi:Core-2/I-Branching enzyme